jgi:hypothetical protein
MNRKEITKRKKERKRTNKMADEDVAYIYIVHHVAWNEKKSHQGRKRTGSESFQLSFLRTRTEKHRGPTAYSVHRTGTKKIESASYPSIETLMGRAQRQKRSAKRYLGSARALPIRFPFPQPIL